MSAVTVPAACVPTASTTLWDVFRRSLETNARQPALGFEGVELSYGEVASAVANRAAQLAAAGVGARDRVVLLMENGLGFPVTDLAVMALGAVKVPLNGQLTAAEVQGIVARITPRVACVSPALRPLIDESDVTLLDDAIDLTPGTPLPAVGAARPEDPAAIYFTGGTTGKPKGIVHAQYPTVVNFMAHLIEGGLQRDERLLLNTPLSHAAGLFTLASLLRGSYARIERAFDAPTTLDTIDADRITWTFAVPTMIYRLLDVAEERDWRPTSLRTVQYGAAPISATGLRRAIDRFGPIFQQLFGQTECPNFATVLRKEDHVRALEETQLLRSCGRASLMCDVSIRSEETGDEVAQGATGELCLRSVYVLDRYWDDPDAYGKRFHGDWLRTGDIGYQDAEGNVFLVDRLNDMIISGGMNVYSLEVEDALVRHPDVRAAAVVGVPHEHWGEAVHAVVVAGGAVDEATLLAYARKELGAYKRPKSVEFVDALPLTVYGKVDKKALRAPHWQDHDRAIG